MTDVGTSVSRRAVVPRRKTCALSFDDGPNTATTVQVLDMLERYGVRASFFLVGKHITEKTAAVMRRAQSLGCSLENHSFSHSDMTAFEAGDITAEIRRTSELVENVTGVRPSFFRPPYIKVNGVMYRAAGLPFICGKAAADWDPSVTAAARAERILSAVDDGDIILLHDTAGNDKTVTALEVIIPGLLGRGYQLLTVPELFAQSGADIHAGNKIWTNVYE